MPDNDIDIFFDFLKIFLDFYIEFLHVYYIKRDAPFFHPGQYMNERFFDLVVEFEHVLLLQFCLENGMQLMAEEGDRFRNFSRA